MMAAARLNTKKNEFPMCDALFASMFRRLVKKAGGVDAAASAISALVGHEVSKGTISKVQNGLAEVPMLYVHALEDATGDYRFTKMRLKEIEERIGSTSGKSLALHAGAVSKEAGEAVNALITASETGCPKAVDEARLELEEMRDAADDALIAIKGANSQ